MAATHTPYYNLNKPDRQDFVSVVTDINDNMDKIDTALHGKASLDGSGKVPVSELPSYVDDVIEGYLYNGQFYKEAAHTTLITPEGDKIYVDIPTSSSYRWSGSLYVKIDDPKEIIDDNAGIGDTDLVYSADKVVKLFRSEHEDLTSGNAEQVIGKVASTEKGAYLYRRGMHLGNRCREKVVGGTVAWNQLISNGDFSNSTTGWTNAGTSSFSVTSGVAQFTCNSARGGIITSRIGGISGHKYLYIAKVKCTTADTPVRIVFTRTNPYIKIYDIGTQWEILFGMVGDAISTSEFQITDNRESNWDAIYVDSFMCIDLTQMFGSTVADTLYGMGEAGVAWFRERFSKDYYAYDAGSLQSVQAASKVIKDANNNTVHTYPFDTSLVLRGIPKLDSHNRLYYDGDEYESSGKVTRKYGIVDLGTLTWTYDSENTRFYSETINAKLNANNETRTGQCICAKYKTLCNHEAYDSSWNKVAYIAWNGQITNHIIMIHDLSYTDAATFETAMSGVYLVYELATPTTEQASPFTPIMSFDPKGTEEFTEWGTRDVAVPVGHITEYLTDPAKILNNIPLIEVEKESASVVTFSDGAEGLPLKELTVKVEPVQDLHGYENPWPAGGGKNLIGATGGWNENGVLVPSASAIRSEKIAVSPGDKFIASKKTAFTVAWENLYALLYDSNGDFISQSAILLYSATSGSAYTVPSGAAYIAFSLYLGSTDYSNIASYEVQVEKGDTITTFAPYSNICPISGLTGAKVTRTGKNLLSEPKSGVNQILCDVKEGVTYTVAWDETENTGYNIYLNKDGVDTACPNAYVIGKHDGWFVFTAPYDCKVKVNNYSTKGQNKYRVYVGTSNAKPDYVEPSGETYSITFPTSAGTVYGGTVKVEKDGSGTLVVNKRKNIINGNTLSSMVYSSDNECLAGYIPAADAPIDTNNQLFNYLEGGGSPSTTKHNIAIIYANRITRINISSIEQTVEAYKTYLNSNNLECVYNITPITYSLTPAEVETLLGINNIWADTGDTALTYRADLKKYIDAKIAELSAAITALGT